MKYDLSNTFQAKQFDARCEALKRKGAKVELCEKKTNRTLSQNALFHLWIRVFADCIGDTNVEQLKLEVKRHTLGRRVIRNRFTDADEFADYSTAQMDTKQMSDLLDRFKAFAMTDFGCYLPYEGEDGYREMLNEYL